ncbi:MAG: tetratricopeptide repeat protein [Pseudomonadota bacterium]
MELKKLCPNFKWLAIGISLLILTGCATRTPRPLPSPEKPVVSQPFPPKGSGGKEASKQTVEKPPLRKSSPPQTENQPDPSLNHQSPMALAALALSDQGQAHLKNGKPDEAIRVLERAVNLHPRNGETYYYLAEAWFMKGNAAQAKEFNHLAAIHIKADPEWGSRIQSQRVRINKLK